MFIAKCQTLLILGQGFLFETLTVKEEAFHKGLKLLDLRRLELLEAMPRTILLPCLFCVVAVRVFNRGLLNHEVYALILALFIPLSDRSENPFILLADSIEIRVVNFSLDCFHTAVDAFDIIPVEELLGD